MADKKNKNNVLVVGSGGREHTMTHFLQKSENVNKVYTAPGNAGTPNNIAYDSKDFKKLADFVEENNVGLTVVGPEVPLCDGIVDIFNLRNLNIFGPVQKAALITEGDKASAREFMQKYGIPQPEFKIFDNFSAAKDYLSSLSERRIVVKASGLAAGKGVYVCEDLETAVKAAEEIMQDRRFNDAGNKMVIEECMEGEEASVFAVCDGKNAVYLATAQDHKRIGEGDSGLNTGGTGAYAPVGIVTDDMLKKVDENIVKKTLEGMAREGMAYKGCLYVGLMIKDNEPKVVEYNCRFGDPETQAVLALLKTDMYELFDASAAGNLDKIDVVNHDGFACCVVLMSEGYPESYETGKIISGLDKAGNMENLHVFHAGTKTGPNGEILTAGGRVMNVVGLGPTIEEAINRAYKGADAIEFENKYLRRDIGFRALKRA